MEPENPEEESIIAHDIFPYLREYKDGTVHRLAGTESIPPGVDPKTGVTSYDVEMIAPPEDDEEGGGATATNVSIAARIYHPENRVSLPPLVIYLHGGAFVIATSGEPRYHQFLNTLCASSNAIVLSVDYRLAPEHPLPAAFNDAWGVIRWVDAQSKSMNTNTSSKKNSAEELVNGVDFSRVYIVGDSAGATMGHHMGCRVEEMNGIKLKGIAHIHPYFWGKVRIGYEVMDERSQMVDAWWEYVCPSDRGCDDPLINPSADGAPKMEKLLGCGCERLLVCVAEKDVLKDRGVAYYQEMVNKKKIDKWAELFETKGEDHVFHIFDLDSVKARKLMARLVEFINWE